MSDRGPNMSEIGIKNEREVAEVQRHLFEAIKMAKEGNFKGVIEHLKPSPESQQVLDNIGVRIRVGRSRLGSVVGYDTSEANAIAYNSDYSIINKSITLGAAPVNSPQYEHDAALVAMEEWGHAIQNVKGKSFDRTIDDHEIDIAAYFLQNEVPVTRAFMDRYDRLETLRAAHLISPDQERRLISDPSGKGIDWDDSRTAVPALRRGVFIDLPSQEPGIHWQVKNFDPKTGDALLFDGVLQRQMTIKRGDIDPTWVNKNDKFADCNTWLEVVRRVRELGGLASTGGKIYDQAEIQKIIDETRGNGKGLERFPRAGGLRARMAELYGQTFGVKMPDAQRDQMKTVLIR